MVVANWKMNGLRRDGRDFARALARLRRAGILANTLFVFLIDNGWSNGLISKGSPYEKGVRTPIVFTWPGHIRPGRVGQLVSSIDVYPTVLDYAGVPIPAQAAGRSLRPLLEGGEWEPREVLCGAVYDRAASDGARPERDVFALYSRLEGWKYVLYVRDVPESMWLITEAKPLGRLGRREGEEELFDLEADPYELENLATDPEHGTLLKWMRNEALRWWKRTGGNDLEE